MNLSDLKKFVETPGIELIAHNAQHEFKWFLARGINANIVHDTRVLARLYDERMSAKLGALSLKFGVDKYYKEGNPTELQGKDLADRPTRDARNTYLLMQQLYAQLSENEKRVYHEVLVPAAKTLAQIELEGVCIDRPAITELSKGLAQRIAALKLEQEPAVLDFEQAYGKQIKGGRFNVGSPQQKQILIYDILGYPVLQTTDSGSPSTEAEVLEALLRLQHTEEHHAGLLDDCTTCKNSTLNKITSASKWGGWNDRWLQHLPGYLVDIGSRSFLFTDLMGEGAATGRVVSANPNLQNIARAAEMRSLFISRYGELWELDYKGIELRIWACLAEDERLIEAIIKEDPHTATAQDIYAKKTISKAERQVAKTFLYCLINGGGPFRLTLVTGIPLKEMEVMFKRFWRAHRSGQTFWQDWVEADEWDVYGRPKAGIVYSPTGMKRHFTKPTEARNHLIQNTALVVLLKAINIAVPHIKASGRGVADLVVHDSLRLDTKPRSQKLVAEVKEIMEQQKIVWQVGRKTHIISLPFLVEVKRGKNWGSMEEVKL